MLAEVACNLLRLGPERCHELPSVLRQGPDVSCGEFGLGPSHRFPELEQLSDLLGTTSRQKVGEPGAHSRTPQFLYGLGQLAVAAASGFCGPAVAGRSELVRRHAIELVCNRGQIHFTIISRLTDDGEVMIRIEGFDLPGSSCGPSPDSPDGYGDIHVGLQRRNRRDEWLGLTRADAQWVTWKFPCEPRSGPSGFDLRGPYVQGPPAGRFIYLSWVAENGAKEFRLFRRAKLWLDAVPSGVIEDAINLGFLVGRVGLTDEKGNPTCASIRPPAIEWSAQGPPS